MLTQSAYNIIEALSTVRDYIRWGASRFTAAGIWFGHGTDNAWDEATQLVLDALHLPWDTGAQALDCHLTQRERLVVYAQLEIRVKTRVPAAYLIGEACFAGWWFNVDRRVLIPRSPIAELIEQSFQPWLNSEPRHILDLCTGSGCIGISCAHVFPDAQVDLIDLSVDALAVAKGNIARHRLEDRVTAIQSNLFGGLKQQTYDLIVSNPPYVDAIDFEHMPQEFRYEPAMGLVAGQDGLDLVRIILQQAANHLTTNGLLIVEVGNSGEALELTYPSVPFLWFEFERGGHGVFMLTAKQLREHQQSFSAACAE